MHDLYLPITIKVQSQFSGMIMTAWFYIIRTGLSLSCTTFISDGACKMVGLYWRKQQGGTVVNINNLNCEWFVYLLRLGRLRTIKGLEVRTVRLQYTPRQRNHDGFGNQHKLYDNSFFHAFTSENQLNCLLTQPKNWWIFATKALIYYFFGLKARQTK